MKLLQEGRTNVFINKPGHKTKMAIIPIYGKNLSKILSRTGEPISRKLAVYIKHDPVMTLTYFFIVSLY